MTWRQTEKIVRQGTANFGGLASIEPFEQHYDILPRPLNYLRRYPLGNLRFAK